MLLFSGVNENDMLGEVEQITHAIRDVSYKRLCDSRWSKNGPIMVSLG